MSRLPGGVNPGPPVSQRTSTVITGQGGTYTVPFTGTYDLSLKYPLNASSTGTASVANAPSTLSVGATSGGSAVQLGDYVTGPLTKGTVLTLSWTVGTSDSGASCLVSFVPTPAHP